MKKLTLLVVLSVLVLLSVGISAEKVRYDNYKVYRIIPKSQNDVIFFNQLQKNSIYNFWSDHIIINGSVDVMVPPSHQENFEVLLKTTNAEFNVWIENVQKLIDEENPIRTTTQAEDFNWTSYHDLDEIYAWLKSLAEKYPDQVTLVKGGTTYENRDILGVHISFAPGNENRSVFVESNIHACEWIGSAVSTYILNQILTTTDPVLREIADTHDWYFFPIFNPDGFVHTHQINRIWRKNRVPYGDCIGVDLNRNWDYHWNDGGTVNDSCSEYFLGASAFSEPAARSLSEYISTIGDSLEAYFSFHSYAQILLLPYGYTTDHLDNYDQLREIGLKGLEKLTARYGTEYKIGNVAEILYAASGGSPDWIKGTFGTKITYTYELRDQGKYGFLLPASQIIPTAEETLDSIITIFQEFAKDDEDSRAK